jgi:hypothetical protein
MIDYYNDRVYHTPSFSKEYASTCWVPIEAVAGAKDLPKPIYHDSHFAAYDTWIPGGEIYSLQFPKRYSQFRQERISVPSTVDWSVESQ